MRISRKTYAKKYEVPGKVTKINVSRKKPKRNYLVRRKKDDDLIFYWRKKVWFYKSHIDPILKKKQ